MDAPISKGRPVPDDTEISRSAAWEGLSVEERFRASVGGSQGTPGSAGHGVLASFRRRLIGSDVVTVLLALALGLGVSSRETAWSIHPLVAIYGTPVLIGAIWIAFLGLRGTYDERIVGLGTEEVRRVISATMWTFAVVAGTSYLIRADISRAYAFVSLPVGVIAIAAVRFAWRSWLYRARAHGRFMLTTIVIGSPDAAEQLVTKLTQDSYTGYTVAATLALPSADPATLSGWLDDVDQVIATTGAHAIAVVASDTTSDEVVRHLAWRIEGRSLDLLIAPAMLDVAGPRLSVRPAAGLPLLHLDEVALSKPQRFAKRTLDLLAATVLIALLSPALLVIALSIRLTSAGPVIFKQIRIGRNGVPFTMLKYRTMVVNADSMREQLRAEHDLDDPMFKMANDPRITSVGSFLRRWSLDELPQLFNVFGGSMSLVGPRPHPVDDVTRYESEAYRRLALKPGMTGLWQVEGRSDLDWAEALQLDLYYVERWTMAGDVVLMLRTIRAVLQGRGAL